MSQNMASDQGYTVCYLLSKLGFLRWLFDSHITECTGIVFGETHLGVERNPYAFSLDQIPSLLRVEMR